MAASEHTVMSPQPPVAPLYTAAVAPFYSAVDILAIIRRRLPEDWTERYMRTPEQ